MISMPMLLLLESGKDKEVFQAEDNQQVWVSFTAPDNFWKMIGQQENSV